MAHLVCLTNACLEYSVSVLFLLFGGEIHEKIGIFLIIYFFVSACATVDRNGNYNFDEEEFKARATNATAVAAAGYALGKPKKGAAIGAVVGGIIDPHECSDGYREETAERASTTDGAPGTYKGVSSRRHNKRCGNEKGGAGNMWRDLEELERHLPRLPIR